MMTQEQAADLVAFIKAHSRDLQVGSVKAQRIAKRAQTWCVTAMVSAPIEHGIEWWQESWHTAEGFTASQWHDALAPLRTEVLLAEHAVQRAKARLRERIDQTLRALRDTADRIESDAANLGIHEFDSPERLAERVVGAVLWMAPNLQLPNLPRQGRDIEDAIKRHDAAALALSNAEMAQVRAVPFIVAEV